MKTLRHGSRKLRGAHFTPPRLAAFLASKLAEHLHDGDRELRVLDPACGDGVLLEAFRFEFGERHSSKLCLVGVESHGETARMAEQRFATQQHATTEILAGDFLQWWGGRRESPALWDHDELPAALREPFDVVIANPPYVRTQIIGARRAQDLAADFGLAGRVDLYHPFLIAATESLRPGGLLGVITSNRWLFTQAGASVRTFLADRYDVLDVVDLGDTKIFEAAVLPAIFVGRRRSIAAARSRRSATRFVRIYSRADEPSGTAGAVRADSVFDLLDAKISGIYRSPEATFGVATGRISIPANSSAPWVMLDERERSWVQHIRQNSVGLLQDFASVRVGIKTTADRVFIRADWDSLPPAMQPEPALLRPILTHQNARRWLPNDSSPPCFRVLYTHETVRGRRSVIDLARFPRARRYLESHRQELEAREYVMKSGRKWFEIWVPQDPDAWALPKIVCPDISPEPRFYSDARGILVDGDSYWITVLPGQPEYILFLLLGVANSTLMSNYHDLAFQNRLYSGRRRYLTQHVAEYPMPDPTKPASRQLSNLVRSFVSGDEFLVEQLAGFERAVDALVSEVFSCSPRPSEEQR